MVSEASCYQLEGKYYLHQLNNNDVIIILDQIPDWLKTSITGKWILEQLKNPLTIDGLVHRVMKKYELPKEAVFPVIEKTINEFYKHGIVSKDGRVNRAPYRQSIEELSLQQLWFNVTNDCNLSCPHCFARTDKENQYSPLTESLSLITQAGDMGVQEIVLSGGEPTLHPGLATIVREASRIENCKVKLITNGFLSRTEAGRQELMKLVEYLDDIQVSIDGHDEQTHDAIRGPGSFQAATTAIKMLTALEGKELKVGISFTPLPENLSELPKLYKLALSLGVDYIHLNRGKRPANRGKGIKCEYLKEDFVRRVYSVYDQLLIESYKSYEDMRGLSLKVPTIDTSFDPASELITPLKRPRCSAGFLTIAVNPDGSVFPCAALIRRQDLLIGNIFETNLNTVYQKAREIMATAFSVEREDKCRQCEVRYFCGGGCRATAEGIKERDLLCPVIKERFFGFWERISLPVMRTYSQKTGVESKTGGKQEVV